MSIAVLKQYVAATYPALDAFITDEQYQQIDWLDTTHQTNEQVPVAPVTIHLQQQRIFARLHFLSLFREGSPASYQRFIAGQKEPQLTEEHFRQCALLIQGLSDLAYQQLWIATATCKSVTANGLAKTALDQDLPFDSVDFLATVMTKAPQIYPAVCALPPGEGIQKNFAAMFDTGHFRHMLYVEGGPNMFLKLRQKIKSGQIDKKSLDLWFAYWLIDIAGFRAQTKELGSAYLNDHTFRAVMCLKNHLDILLKHSDHAVLYHYLNDRAGWLGLPAASAAASVFAEASAASDTPRLILARIAAMQRLFTQEEQEGLMRGLATLKTKLGDTGYEQLLSILNPLQETDEPTPTYGPALLANLRGQVNYEQAIVIGLPIYAQALTTYRASRRDHGLNPQLPLNLNGLAAPESITALIAADQEPDSTFSVAIDPSNGTTTLTKIKLEAQVAGAPPQDNRI